MAIDFKNFGSVLIGLSIILLFLLTFIKIDNDSKSLLLCEKFHDAKENMKDCPIHKSYFSWMIIIAYSINFIMLIIGVYILFSAKFVKTESKNNINLVEFDEAKLNEEEKIIINLIKSNEGSVYQSNIIKETGFSKVKTTRLLDKLEAMKIIERKRRGMANIIILK